MTFKETCEAANASIASGCDVYQRFTCTHCGARLEISEPNKFFTKCVCDRCKHITDIRESGCSYVAHRALA
jgi:rRNA maturation protein Nop10